MKLIIQFIHPFNRFDIANQPETFSREVSWNAKDRKNAIAKHEINHVSRFSSEGRERSRLLQNSSSYMLNESV